MDYTAEQLARRNASKWTPVQAILAPLQFLTFLVCLVLVLRYLNTGSGFDAAHFVSLIKVVMMLAITITGMFWEHDVYGHYFLAKEFFWEDLVNGLSMIVHLAFVAAWLGGVAPHTQMLIMVAALSAYVINFVQFGYRGYRAMRQRRAMKAAASA